MSHTSVSPEPKRFIGLDIHKRFFVATGVNAKQETAFGPHKVDNTQLEKWAEKELTPFDAVVIEMTTNAYTVHDLLVDRVHSVTVVHPPLVAMIASSRVKTDKRDALILAQLLAAGLLSTVWIPPQEVRDLRALIAQRWKMLRLRSLAKNRLHSVLHRHQIVPFPGIKLFAKESAPWWLALPVSTVERGNLQCDLNTLFFADEQLKAIEETLKDLAAEEERMPLLVQIPGVGLVTGMTILSAIGTIERFPHSRKLVGYAGLGARVSETGGKRRTGSITKAGRKELRHALVQVARIASRTHPHWKQELARLAPRIGTKRAIVAIARKLLVAVWHILSKEEADRFASPWRVAAGLHLLAYRIGVRRLPEKTAKQYVRNRLDRLGVGRELTHVPWGTKNVKLPPSRLPEPEKA